MGGLGIPITTMYRRLISSLKQMWRWSNNRRYIPSPSSASLIKPLLVYVRDSSSLNPSSPPIITLALEGLEYLRAVGLDYLFEGVLNCEPKRESFGGESNNNNSNNNDKNREDEISIFYHPSIISSPVLSVDVLQYGPFQYMDVTPNDEKYKEELWESCG
jgi:hypothetical protein